MDAVKMDVLTKPWGEISVKAISPQASAFLIIWIKATSAHLLFRDGQLYLLVHGLGCYNELFCLDIKSLQLYFCCKLVFVF